jgi:TRAP-type mannitol/chloroaromatic compound transport system substrate-binding protein
MYGKDKALVLFSGVPFGPSPRRMAAWLERGGGKAMLNDLYRSLGVHVVSTPCGIIGPEGDLWLNREIRSPADLRGLKVRWVGLQTDVAQAAGMKVVQLPGGEIVPALERGVIEATNFVGPSEDRRFGMHDIFQYYYYPGVMTPTHVMEFLVNADRWHQLSRDAQRLIEATCAENVDFAIAEHERRARQDLAWLRSRGVRVQPWPPAVTNALRRAWQQVADTLTSSNVTFGRVYQSMAAYRQ